MNPIRLRSISGVCDGEELDHTCGRGMRDIRYIDQDVLATCAQFHGGSHKNRADLRSFARFNLLSLLSDSLLYGVIAHERALTELSRRNNLLHGSHDIFMFILVLVEDLIKVTCPLRFLCMLVFFQFCTLRNRLLKEFVSLLNELLRR